MNIIKAQGLRVDRGGVNVLDIQDLIIDKGDFLSVIGPNGAGKSTLLLSLAGLVDNDKGQISFHGKLIRKGLELIAFRRSLAMVFQEPLLFDSTVYENVASGLKIRGMSRKRIQPIVEEHLLLFGIAHLSGRSSRRISGGEAQRTSLARAFATDPELILLDEPFASLDPPTKESIIEDLGHVMRLKHTTAVMATHDRMDAIRLSNKIVVMDRGKIIQVGSPSQVMQQPASEDVAMFVGVETVLEGEIVESSGGMLKVNINGKDIFVTGMFDPGDKVVCFIRPEYVTVFPGDVKEQSSARNVFCGMVSKVQHMGFFFRVCIDCGFILCAHITQQAIDELHIKPGMDVVCAFKATAVHVIKKV